MIKDEFKLSKLNILLILLNIFLVLFVILASVQLIRSLNDSNETIPNLRTTADKTSTKEADRTKKTTEETTSATTKKVGNTSSPYYDINIEELFSEEVLTKSKPNFDEKKQLIELMYKKLSYLLDVTNDEVIDIPYLLDHVKEGEKDAIEFEGHKYGQIYNAPQFFEKLFRYYKLNSFMSFKYDKTQVLKEVEGTYYKVENLIGKPIVHVDSYSVESSNDTRIQGKVVYYNTNYKEKGLSAPQYSSSKMDLVFNDEVGMWQIESFTFPNLEA